MKTRFVKAAVWMLVVSLLAVAVSFTVAAADTPVSEFTANWSLSASAQTVNLDGVNSQTVTVSLVTNKTGVYCDGIAGRWDTQTASGKITMSNTGLVINESIVKTGNTDEALNTPNYAYPITGEFMWVNSILAPVGNFGANFAIVTATYVIDPKTPTGTYVINFTKTVYAGAADVSETEETLSIAIQVNGHTCTPSEWMSDATKHWKECTVCHEIINNSEMNHGGGTANCQSAAICTTCKLPYGDVNPTVHAATETQRSETEHWEVCKACHAEVTNSRYGHQYTLMGNTQCACGAVKHICAGNLTAHAAVAPTCKTKGNSAYWSCTCGNFYSDAAATFPIAENSWMLAVDPTNHESTEVTYTDNGENHSATYNCCGGAYVTNEDHDFTNGDCACGKVKPVTNVKVDYKGAALKNAYTVNGQVVTVTYSSACKVGYLQNGKYVTTNITKNKISDNCYSFTIPDGVTEVVLIVKGDISGDGRFLANDKAAINAALSGKMSLSADKTFAGDITGDGRFLANDKAAINAILAGKITLAW
jgi:hypothetical protein